MHKNLTIIAVVLLAVVLQLAVLFYMKHQARTLQTEQIFEVTAEEAEAPLRFGIIMNRESEKVPKQIQPLLKSLEKAVERKVKLVVLDSDYMNDFGKVGDALKNNDIDLGILAPSPMSRAVEEGYGEVFASTIDLNGLSDHRSTIFVHKDSDIKSIRDLMNNRKKYSFAYGDNNSNFRNKLPLFFLTYYRIRPADHFTEVKQLGFSEVFDSVLDRSVDIGVGQTMAMCQEVLDRKDTDCSLINPYPNAAEELRVIWESPPIKLHVLGFRKNLDENLKGKIKKFFYAYGKNSAQERVLRNIDHYRLTGFKEYEDSELNYFRLMQKYSTLTVSAEKRAVLREITPFQKKQNFYEVVSNGAVRVDRKGVAR